MKRKLKILSALFVLFPSLGSVLLPEARHFVQANITPEIAIGILIFIVLFVKV